MKRILTLSLLLVVLCTQTAFARYSDVKQITATMSVSSGTATCRGSVKPYDSNTKSAVKVSLMRKEGGTWKEFASWSGSGTGVNGASASGTKKLVTGYQYKVETVGTVKDSSGRVLETATKSSPVVND